MSENFVVVESTGKIVRTGISKSGNQYIFAEAFLVNKESKYPERFEYFAASNNEVLPEGIFRVPFKVSVRDGKVDFYLIFKDAQRYQKPN